MARARGSHRWLAEHEELTGAASSPGVTPTSWVLRPACCCTRHLAIGGRQRRDGSVGPADSHLLARPSSALPRSDKARARLGSRPLANSPSTLRRRSLPASRYPRPPVSAPDSQWLAGVRGAGFARRTISGTSRPPRPEVSSCRRAFRPWTREIPRRRSLASASKAPSAHVIA
jgi:hypothetical protein